MTRSFIAAVLVLLAVSLPAAAQDYPVRGVRIVVPFGAGGPADIYARLIAQHLSTELKQPFTVENKPGGGAVVGTTEVVRAAADGYTLLMMSNTHATNETLIADKPYVLMRDLVGVAAVNASDILLVAHPSVPAGDLASFIALARARPRELNYASSGPGTPYHMAGELFKAMSGTDIVHVPYKSSGEARNAVIAGHVQMMPDAITTMAPNVRAGQVRALATTGRQRSTVLPDVPTVAEAGVPGYEATIWLGLMAPAATPPAIVARLNAEVNRILARPEILEAWNRQGAVPMPMDVGSFDRYLRAEIAKWADVVRRSGARAQ